MSPPYQDIARDLARRIASGEFPVGTHLPVGPALAEEYGVSPGTVGRALRKLDMDGLITTEAGSRAGAVVDRTRTTRPDLTDLTERVERLEREVFKGGSR